MLEALDSMHDGLSDDELGFLVQAWKAAFTTAKALGWLTLLFALTIAG